MLATWGLARMALRYDECFCLFAQMPQVSDRSILATSQARNLPPEYQVIFQELNDGLKTLGLKGITKSEALFLLKIAVEVCGSSHRRNVLISW